MLVLFELLFEDGAAVVVVVVVAPLDGAGAAVEADAFVGAAGAAVDGAGAAVVSD